MKENIKVIFYEELNGTYTYIAPETHDFGEYDGQVPNVGDLVVSYGGVRDDPESKTVMEVVARYFVTVGKPPHMEDRIHLVIRRRPGTEIEKNILWGG